MFARWQVLVIPFSVLVVISPIASGWKTRDEENCIGVPPNETAEYVGNANIVIDEVLQAVSAYLRKTNHTQIDIPDQESDFEFWLKGNLSLREGKVSGYDRIKRIGNAEIRYLDRGTSSSVAVQLEGANFLYENTKVVIASNTFQGKVTASLEQLSMRINMSVNLESLCKKIDSVKIENLNSIKVAVDIKSWIPSTLTNTLVNTVTWIYRNRIVPAIQNRTAEAIQKFFDSFDLDDVLRPDYFLNGV